MIIAIFMTIPLLLFSLLFAYVSHHIMLSRCCNLTTLPLPYPLSFASLDTHDNGIAESSWLTDYYNNSCRCRLCDDLDARAMFDCLGVLLLLLLRSGDRFQVGSLGKQGGCCLSFCLCFIRSRMLILCMMLYSCGILCLIYVSPSIM